MTRDLDHERLTELIHGEIDGVNDAAESAELRYRLAATPEARAEY
jgi:anti-sigma factor RsiW